MAKEVPIGFDLIVFDDKEKKPRANPATKAIPVFKEIFARARRGTNLGHEQAQQKVLSEFLYIYYMIDIRSFAVQRLTGKENDTERHHLVVETLKLDSDWWPDSVVEKAAEFYEEFQFGKSPALRMLRSGYRAINKTVEYLENVDFDKVGIKGRKLYTSKDVLETLDSLQLQKTRIDKLMQEAIRDINLGGRPKGGGSIGFFEDAPSDEEVESRERIPAEL